MLGRLRTTFRWKADGLDKVGLGATVGASSLTIGGLLKHLALVEDLTFCMKMSDASPGPPWDPANWEADGDWEFTSAITESPATLYSLYDGKVARARQRLQEAIANGGIDQLVHDSDDKGNHASLRRLICDLIGGVWTAHRPRGLASRGGGRLGG